VAEPLVGLLSIGEESSKGTSLVKETNELLAADPTVNFFGNVEGRDLIPGVVDVVVTDGFTGNVALKTLEGAFKFVVNAMLGVIDTNEETRRAGETLFPYLHTQFRALSPDHHGGAMLLGLNGICVISHGSSNDTAIMNAIRIADEMHNSGVVNKMRVAIRPDQE
jgi:glycerol-3-phosphate acyltransferase PlsX